MNGQYTNSYDFTHQNTPYTIDNIIDIINNDDFAFDDDPTDPDLIGSLKITKNNGIISSPLINPKVDKKITNTNCVNYEIISNLKKGLWHIGKFSFNRSNDVYIFRYRFKPNIKKEITTKIISSVINNYNNNIGFYVYCENFSLHDTTSAEYKICGTSGITIGDPDSELKSLNVTVVISEASGDTFKIIVIKHTPNLDL